MDQTEWIRGLARRLVQDAAKADDLVQDTLLAALEKRPAGDRSLRPWLAVVLRRRLAFLRRGEGRRRARERAGAVEEALPSSAELLERAEIRSAVGRAVTTLREPYRSVLLLRYHEGLEPSEIARRGGLPAATVRSQLKRGLDELRTALDREHGGERRRWALALVPLALEAPAASGSVWPAAIVGAGAVTVAAVGLWTLGSRATAHPPLVAGPSDVQAATDSSSRGAAEPTDRPGVGLAPSPERRESVPSERTDSAVASARDERFAGRLLERGSGRPIPHYALELEDADGESELVWTDAEGRWQSARDPVVQKLQVTYLDHPDMIGLMRYTDSVIEVGRGLTFEVDFDPTHVPYVWETSVGPTYPLALEAPFAWDSMALVGSLRAAEGEPTGELATDWSLRAPVRRPDGPWIRFQPNYRSLPPDRPWQLSIESHDGLWGGQVLVQPGEGVYPEPVRLTLVARAALEVQLLGTSALREPAVTLESVAHGGRRALERLEQRPLDTGASAWSFEARAVPAGTYRILVRAGGEESLAAIVELPAGAWTRRTLEVGATPELAHVRGELRSESGTLDEAMQVQLSGNGGLWSEHPRWIERGGRKVAPFAFENLPPGEYALRLISDRTFRRWEPAERRISPPAENVVLTCADEAPARDLWLRIHMPNSKGYVPAVGIVTVPGSPQPRTGFSGGGESQRTFMHSSVPVGAALTWYAWAEGYAPQQGDEGMLVEEGERDVIEVTLERGWGGRISVADEGGAPLAGVEVRLDGVLATTTDAAGIAVVAAAAEPSSVELRAEGFAFEQGDWDPETRRLTGELGLHNLRFARR